MLFKALLLHSGSFLRSRAAPSVVTKTWICHARRSRTRSVRLVPSITARNRILGRSARRSEGDENLYRLIELLLVFLLVLECENVSNVTTRVSRVIMNYTR